jgi:hypothetical protein
MNFKREPFNVQAVAFLKLSNSNNQHKKLQYMEH